MQHQNFATLHAGDDHVQQVMIDIEIELSRYMQNYFDEGTIAKINEKHARAKEQDLFQFVEGIVSSVVFAPAQEIFTVGEISEAIVNKKAIDFASAFLDVAIKIVDLSMLQNKMLEEEMYKNYMDFFALSIFSFSLSSTETPSEIFSSFLPENKICDHREHTFHDSMNEHFFTQLDDKSGALVFAHFLYKNYTHENSNIGGDLLWTNPPHTDKIFIY